MAALLLNIHNVKRRPNQEKAHLEIHTSNDFYPSYLTAFYALLCIFRLHFKQNSVSEIKTYMRTVKTIIHPVCVLDIIEMTKQKCIRLPMKGKYRSKLKQLLL